MDDVRAVMDAAGSERAALIGVSEGGTMCMLFAATYPERTSALVLCGAMARSTWAEDYPWAPEKEAAEEALAAAARTGLGAGRVDRDLCPDLRRRSPGARVPGALRASGREPDTGPAVLRNVSRPRRPRRAAADPGADPGHAPARRPRRQLPRRSLARRADRGQPLRRARGQPTTVPGSARTPSVLDEIEEFLTGARPSRESIASWRPCCSPTSSTRPSAPPSSATGAGGTCSSGTSSSSGASSSASAAVRSRRRATGSSRPSTGRPGPSMRAGDRRRRARSLGIEVRAGMHTGEVELIGEDIGGIAVHVAARIAALAEGGTCSSRAPSATWSPARESTSTPSAATR